MAQVSIQYSIDAKLDEHDEKCLKRSLNEFFGVKSVIVNIKDSIVCIDYDDTGIKREAIEQCLTQYKYPYSMMDQIIFER